MPLTCTQSALSAALSRHHDIPWQPLGSRTKRLWQHTAVVALRTETPLWWWWCFSWFWLVLVSSGGSRCCGCGYGGCCCIGCCCRCCGCCWLFFCCFFVVVCCCCGCRSSVSDQLFPEDEMKDHDHSPNQHDADDIELEPNSHGRNLQIPHGGSVSAPNIPSLIYNRAEGVCLSKWNSRRRNKTHPS